ncbi:protein SCO2 homolog, mitochondrial-like [Clavelina lepadiformis]|uniref:protein SCO2 homolog, mitochondrial-like n=1 Tax=Clavelina lepadiformis TaxID=159417 RepID=UPI004041BF85
MTSMLRFRQSLKDIAIKAKWNPAVCHCSMRNQLMCSYQPNRHQLTSMLTRQLFTSTRTYSAENNSDEEKKEFDTDAPLPMRNRIIVVSIVVTGFGILYYLLQQKKENERITQRDQQVSQVDIGAGDYNLVDNTGKRVSKKDFLGKWLLLYFGFTHCPDICPEELEKMAEIIDLVDADKSVPDLLPMFLTVDPERDTPEAINTYVKEFHPKFVGLTGTKQEIKEATKAFRVYFSAGPKDEDNDYIVDHTIVMYLMNPKGNFVDYYGSRSVPTEKIVSGIKKNMKNYKRLHG